MNDKQIANLRADLLQKIRTSGADVKEIRQALTELAGDVETCAHQLDIAPAFSATGNYVAGDLVYNDGALYRFTADHTAGTWTGEDVELTDIAALLDALTGDIAALQPVDSVTDGETKPVTSNAVYDYLNESVSVTRGETETLSAALDRLYALIDIDKVTKRTTLLLGSSTYYHLATKSTSGIVFRQTPLDYTAGNVHIYENAVALKSSGSYYKQVDISTGAGSGSGTGLHWNISDYSSSTSTTTSITLFY